MRNKRILLTRVMNRKTVFVRAKPVFALVIILVACNLTISEDETIIMNDMRSKRDNEFAAFSHDQCENAVNYKLFIFLRFYKIFYQY